MFPQSTQRRSPLRIKNLETDVVNTFHRVHAIAEHVVFDNISLAGSNAHISSSVSASHPVLSIYQLIRLFVIGPSSRFRLCANIQRRNFRVLQRFQRAQAGHFEWPSQS